MPLLQNVYLLIYVTVLINFFTKIFRKFHELFPYKKPESEFDLQYNK